MYRAPNCKPAWQEIECPAISNRNSGVFCTSQSLTVMISVAGTGRPTSTSYRDHHGERLAGAKHTRIAVRNGRAFDLLPSRLAVRSAIHLRSFRGAGSGLPAGEHVRAGAEPRNLHGHVGPGQMAWERRWTPGRFLASGRGKEIQSELY